MSSRDSTLEDQYQEMLKLVRSEEYMMSTGKDKCEILWKAVSSNPYEHLPPVSFSFIATYFRLRNRRQLRQAFDVEEDVRPPRTKAFHPFGTIAKVRFHPVPGVPYTGLLQSGCPALARLSLALDERNFAPSAAFKFCVDRRPTENLTLDQSLDRQTSWDFFERAPTNITLWPRRGQLQITWYLIDWWLSAIAPPLHQYLDHLTSVNADGTEVREPRTPYRLLFFAPGEIHTDPNEQRDFREDIAEIPPGSVLYEVFAKDSPKERGQLHIATVRTESKFVASAFGDRVLSLRHSYPRTRPR